MTSFNHIQSDFMRSVLTGDERNVRSIAGAAYITEAALHADWQSHRLIDEDVLTVKERLVQRMTDCLLDFDVDGAIDALRAYWSV